MLRRRVLQDAMPEVEDMASAGAIAGQYPARFAANRLGLRKQHGRIQIALQGDGLPHVGTGNAEVHRPVHAESITPRCCQLMQPQTPAFGENDDWDEPGAGVALESGDDPTKIGEGELAKSGG